MFERIRKGSFVMGMAVVLMVLAASPAFPKGNDVQFHGTVTRVDLATAATASITLRVVGFNVAVKVSADTEVDSDGDELRLSDIKVGDFVKVSGFFSNSGIEARGITILDRGEGEFRLRGPVTAVRPGLNGILITVLGIDLLVNDDTKIERRGDHGLIAEPRLEVHQKVDTRGIHRLGQFIATRIKIGNREEDQIRVSFSGKITAVEPRRLIVDTEGGSSATVLIGPDTIVTGTPAVGKFVDARGTLNSNLEVVASRVKVTNKKDDDDDGPPRPLTKFDKKISIHPVGGASSIVGEAEAELEQKGSGIQQELEIEFKRALANTNYTIRIDVSGAGTLTLGTVRTDREGEGELKLKTQDGPLSLIALLPSGKTVRDITRVQILTAGGVVVAEGVF